MRVLVAEGRCLIRDGIVSLLEASGFDVVGQVGDGLAAVEAVESLRPELVLLDTSMADMGGLEPLRRIKAQSPQTKVVLLTVAEDDEELMEAVRAQADGYLEKDLTGDEFSDLLMGLSRGQAPMTRSTAARLLHGPSRPSPAHTIAQLLTDREAELLELVAGGLTNELISRRLSISLNTVKYHMKNILHKLGVRNRTEAAIWAMKQGFVEPK